MPWFEYEGHTPGGTLIAGRLEAADTDAARRELARMDIEVNRLNPSAPDKPPPATLTVEELMFFNQQLAGLAKAGLALDEGLAQLARDIGSGRMQRWIEDLVEDLRRGAPLDQALAERESSLPLLYGQVVRAGIQTGRLPIVLLNLNQHLQTTGVTRRILWEAASYPLVLGVLALGVVSFFFTCVVPQFDEMFKDFGTRLPVLTVFILEVAHHFPLVLIMLGAMIGGVVLLWLMLRLSPGGRQIRERTLMCIPIIGGVHRASLIARFLRAVSAAVETGITLPQAIRLSSDATGSLLLQSDADRMASEIERGMPVLEANRATRVIPPLFGYCVQTATGRDNLPEALGELARAYEDRVLHGQGLLRFLLLPIFILFIGGVLFIAVAAMFLPLVTLINSVSGGGW